jgi:hypothetical protein
MVHVFNLSTQEAKVGGLFQASLGYIRRTCLKKTKQNKTKQNKNQPNKNATFFSRISNLG